MIEVRRSRPCRSNKVHLAPSLNRWRTHNAGKLCDDADGLVRNDKCVAFLCKARQWTRVPGCFGDSIRFAFADKAESCSCTSKSESCEGAKQLIREKRVPRELPFNRIEDSEFLKIIKAWPRNGDSLLGCDSLLRGPEQA